jgi:uncharacterized protein
MASDHTSLIQLRVQPRAGADGVVGEREGVIVIRLKAPPVDGQANAALQRFVARQLGVPPRDVELVRGAMGRQKWIRVQGLGRDRVRALLLGDV